MNPKSKENAIAYIRVSTKRQADQERSLELQKTAIKKYCKKHGYVLERIFCDAGTSDITLDGNGFEDARAYCKSIKIEFPTWCLQTSAVYAVIQRFCYLFSMSLTRCME